MSVFSSSVANKKNIVWSSPSSCQIRSLNQAHVRLIRNKRAGNFNLLMLIDLLCFNYLIVSNYSCKDKIVLFFFYWKFFQCWLQASTIQNLIKYYLCAKLLKFENWIDPWIRILTILKCRKEIVPLKISVSICLAGKPEDHVRWIARLTSYDASCLYTLMRVLQNSISESLWAPPNTPW